MSGTSITPRDPDMLTQCSSRAHLQCLYTNSCGAENNHREFIQAPQDKWGGEVALCGHGQFESMEICTGEGDQDQVGCSDGCLLKMGWSSRGKGASSFIKFGEPSQSQGWFSEETKNHPISSERAKWWSTKTWRDFWPPSRIGFI